MGCACAQNTMLKALMTYLMVKEKETVVMDMVAGTEHMGRGTAKAVDALIIVVEPGSRSIKAAKEFSLMASALGIKKMFVIGNKINDEEDMKYVQSNMADYNIAGFLPMNKIVPIAERQSASLFEISPEMRRRIIEIKERIFN